MTQYAIEACIPVKVSLSLRLFISPDHELTAKDVDEAVAQLTMAAANDVFRLEAEGYDFSINVIGVDRNGVVDFYDGTKDWTEPLPSGTEFAE